MGTALSLWRAAERFDPDQPRDDKGRWTDGVNDLDLPDMPGGRIAASGFIGDGVGIGYAVVDDLGEPVVHLTAGSVQIVKDTFNGADLDERTAMFYGDDVPKVAKALSAAVGAAGRGKPYRRRIDGSDIGDLLVLVDGDGVQVRVSPYAGRSTFEENEGRFRPMWVADDDTDDERPPTPDEVAEQRAEYDAAKAVFERAQVERQRGLTARLSLEQARVLASALAARQTERFDPHQPRDSRGRWSDAGLHIDDLERFYGTPLDEVEFADGSYVTAYPSGITVNFDEGDEQFSTLAEEIEPDQARALADRVSDAAGRSAEYDEDEDGPAGPNGLVDWSERDGWLVGYYPHGDGVKVGRAVGDGRYDDFDLELGEAAMFAAGLKDMADRLDRETTEGGMSTALALWRTAERFNPDQPRDDHGRWTDGTPGPDPKVDRLKLHGRIPLGPGERLVSSSKTEFESGTIRSAVTDTEFGRSIRLGIGSKGFGSASVGRETGEPVWDGGPGLSVDDFARNEADLRARNEEEARLSDEWHTATGERQDEIDRRLQELDEMPGGDLYRSGATVRLDEEAVADLRSRVDSALTVVERLEADVQAFLDEDPDPDAEVDDVFRARLRQIYADHGLDLSAENSHIFGQGAVYGEWGTLRYEVEWEWNSGWRPRLFVAVEPRGAEDWEIGGENDAYASLELGEARKWLRDLGKQMDSTRESLHSGGTMTTALDIWRATEGRKGFNPSQPRDGDGKWVDRGGARRAQVAASIAAMQNPHPDWAHAGQPDAPWRQGTAGGPAKTPVASAAGGNRHVAHLEGLKSREDAEAYVAGVKGAELEELRKATGVKRGSAASVRQAIVAQTVGSRVDAQTSLGSSGGFGWGDPDAMAGFKPSAPAAPAKKAMPAKKAAPGRTKATGKSADDHLSALSGMSREDAAAYVAALPGKELDEIIAKLPTAVRGRTLAAKRDAIVGGTAGFRADAAGTSGTSTAVLSATDRTGIGDGSFKLGSWADTAEPAAGKPRKRAPRKKAS